MTYIKIKQIKSVNVIEEKPQTDAGYDMYKNFNIINILKFLYLPFINLI